MEGASLVMDDLMAYALQSAVLELGFEKEKEQMQRLYEDERARILRVNILLQQDEEDELREQLQQIQEIELKQSEDFAHDLEDRLADLEEQYEATQAELKTCLRDIDNYQVEINALNTASAASTKTMAEKLALTRELASLKPELEHLRSQVAASDNVLADKLSLERELASLQVELEAEKRTIDRIKQKTTSVDPAMVEELEELRSQLAQEKKKAQRLEKQQTAKRANDKSMADAALVDELETAKEELEKAQRKIQQAERKLEQAENRQGELSEENKDEIKQLRSELTKERKALQKAEREHMKAATEWDTLKENLETKLDAFRNKLRSTKDQLKEAQDELERKEAAKFAESAAATKARIAGRANSVEPSQSQQSQNPRKRNVARFDPDMTIGTPGNGGVTKKPRLTNVGDKSTFSITPFLNRTQSILPESPHAAMNETINELAEEADKVREVKSKQPEKQVDDKPKTKKTATTTAKKAGSSKAKSKSEALKESNARANAVVRAPSLDKVVEEDDDESETVPEAENANPTVTSLTEATTLQPKKKKLLGVRKNIFDDEEPDGIKKTGGLGKVRLGLGRNKPKMLAEFSPLKADRRMTQSGNMTTMVSG